MCSFFTPQFIRKIRIFSPSQLADICLTYKSHIFSISRRVDMKCCYTWLLFILHVVNWLSTRWQMSYVMRLDSLDSITLTNPGNHLVITAAADQSQHGEGRTDAFIKEIAGFNHLKYFTIGSMGASRLKTCCDTLIHVSWHIIIHCCLVRRVCRTLFCGLLLFWALKI